MNKLIQNFEQKSKDNFNIKILNYFIKKQIN